MEDPTQLLLAKHAMLEKQLRGRGVNDPRVLAAFGRVPRERFVPAELRDEAYADRALSIDCGQTISQPYMVGLMTQSLDLTGAETVLEIGGGSGYQTAILAELAGRVASVERHPRLATRAGALLTELGYHNVKLHLGDGTLGWPDWAPYDRIIVTAAAARCPSALWEQLREGGRIVIPVGDSDSQRLQVIRKHGDRAQIIELVGCRFVPLIGAENPRGPESDDG